MTSITQQKQNSTAEGGNPTGTSSRRPYLKPEAGTSWFAVKPADDIYGPCSLKITIETVGVLGQEGQPSQINAFCDGFNDFASTCKVKGYGVENGKWTVSLDLATGKAEASAEVVQAISDTLTPYFQTSAVLQRQHGFGNAKCSVLDGGTTRFVNDLN